VGEVRGFFFVSRPLANHRASEWCQRARNEEKTGKANNMVAAYHLVWTAYGWWMPNDPRGSWSKAIRVERIAGLGDVHFGRKRQQPSRGDLLRFQMQARETLAHRVYQFHDDERNMIADAIATVIAERNYVCHACAIMPEHVHILIRRHADDAETMIEPIQARSKTMLIDAGRRPKVHPVWGGPGWTGFLNSQEDIERTIEYIRNNPLEIGWPIQEWDFVRRYDGWLPSFWD
jgi:REP element-mobilizing transposase RayT